MKKIFSSTGFIALLLFVTMIAFAALPDGMIKGTVSPAESVTDVWAISGKDTFSGSVVGNAFEISKLKKGTYKVVIEAQPYKKAVRDNVRVTGDTSVVDIGEIILEK